MREIRRNRRTSAPARAARPAAFGSWATIRDIEVLRAVVKHGGVSAAARELGISQPAVSRTIAQIERLSGRRLFERNDGEFVPNADALAIYEESTPVFQGLERLEHFRWTEDPKDTFNIVVPPTQSHCLLMPLLPKFLAAHPSLKICVEIRTTLDVVTMVAEASADVGIGEIPSGDWSVRRVPFRRSSLVVALPAEHRLTSARKIEAQDIAGEPMILPVRRNPIRSQVDRLLKTEAGPVNVAIEISNALSAVQLVGRGLGISLVSSFPVMLHSEPGVVFRPFVPDVEQDTCFILPESRPPKGITRQFIDFVRKHQPASSKFSRPV